MQAPKDGEDQRIGAEGTEPVGAERRSGEAKQRDRDEMLDAALACTFPASDPIACAEPSVASTRRGFPEDIPKTG